MGKKHPCNHGKNTCKQCHPHYYCQEHGRYKYDCLECSGPEGSRKPCKHGRRRNTCKACKGTSRCPCGKMRAICKKCNPMGNLVDKVRSRVYAALKRNGMEKDTRTMEYLGCTPQQLRLHLEVQFKEGMSWENQGDGWHQDHVIPLQFGDGSPTEEEILERLHWTNLQPLWGPENLSKGNRYIG